MPLECGRAEFRRACEAFVTEALRVPEWADYESVKALPRFEELSALILREAAAGRIRANKVVESKKAQAKARRLIWDAYLFPLLERCSEAGFDGVYAALEQHLETGRMDWTIIWQEVAPLPGFTAHSYPIELANGVVIRELRSPERRRLADFAEMVGFGQALGLGLYGVNFAMSWWQPAPNTTPASRRAGDEDFGAVMTALRLLKSGSVWYNMRGHWLGHPAFGSNPAVGTFSWTPNPGAPGAGYELLEEDVQPLRDLVGGLVNAAEHNQLSLALRRFDLAYERTRPEDKLIDYWVALEALFLADGRQELSYRVSLRVAWFVAESSGEREEIFRQVRDSYDARSEIVHGEEPKDVPIIAQFTEDVLRRALRKAVAAPGSLDPQRLDSLIVRGS